MGKKMEENSQEIPVKENKFIPTNPIKYEVVKILEDSGLRNKEICKALNLTTGRVSQISKELSKNQDLTSKPNVTLASKAHRLILGHFTNPDKVKLNSTIDIKGSDVTKCIDRVYDRVQSIKRSDDVGNTNISFIEININGYQCK